MDRIYLKIPSDDEMSSRSGWYPVGDKTFVAIQFHIVGIPSRGLMTKKGPPTQTVRVPGGTEYLAEVSRVSVKQSTDEITDSIEDTITTKFSSEVSAKLAAEVGATSPLASGKISTEVQAKSGLELADAVRRGLTTKRSFQIQESQENRSTIKYTATRDTILQFHLEYWPWQWDFYVYGVELLRLRYDSDWIWRKVRDTIEKEAVELNTPLFSVVLYEPQDQQSVTDKAYNPELPDGDQVSVIDLTHVSALPLPPLKPSLQELAKLAFPTNRAERQAAAGKKGLATTTRESGRIPVGRPQKAAGRKKAAAKKGGRKKAAAKKAGRKRAAGRKKG